MGIDASIKRCKNGRTPGFDSLNSALLKELPDEAITMIEGLSNSIIANNTIPQLWKRITLPPTPKSGWDSKLLSDFRHVALSCALVKISEMVTIGRAIHELS